VVTARAGVDELVAPPTATDPLSAISLVPPDDVPIVTVVVPPVPAVPMLTVLVPVVRTPVAMFTVGLDVVLVKVLFPVMEIVPAEENPEAYIAPAVDI
jgi:hypothetical protein